MPRSLEHHLALWISSLLGATILLVAVVPSVSAQSYPGGVISHYMETISTTTHYNLGCSLGTNLKGGSPPQDALVILDYGRALKSGGSYGASLFGFNGGFASTVQIAAAVQEFAHGFWVCTAGNVTAHVRLGVGTSNNLLSNLGSTEATNHGSAWAGMVNSINSYLSSHGYSSQADAVGANDIEVSWSTYSLAKSWVDAYGSAASWSYYDYGDAAGCPTSGATSTPKTCSSSWTQESLYYVSWGQAFGWGVPEIYRTDGTQAKQWQQISKYGVLAHGSKIIFAGSLTQHAACRQVVCDPSLDNTAAQGWSQLYNTLAGDSQTALTTLRFATDIRWN